MTEPLLVWAARFGYAACGFVYIVIGVAAIAVALGLSDKPKGSHGVMGLLAGQPFGLLALATLSVGLAGYAALNLAGAINDPEERGTSFGAIVIRAVDALTAILYIALAVAALGIVVDPAGDRVDATVASATRILALPYGRAMLGLIGAALIVSAGYLLFRASDESFGDMLDKRALSPSARRKIAIAARAGTAARGLIFAVCGILVVKAAASGDSRVVGDVGDALETIDNTPLGPIILGIVGVAFVAYGGYQFAKARYQRIAHQA